MNAKEYKKAKMNAKECNKAKNELILYNKELSELKNTFPKQGFLTIYDVANILEMDVSTLRNKVKEGGEIPKHINIGTGKERKSLRFSLEEVAKYTVKHKKRDDSFMISGSLLNELKAIIAKIENSKK